MSERQAPRELEPIQRNVTARPVAEFRAPQIEARIDPRADDFTNGLLSFADAATGALQKHISDQADAEAASADIGMEGYSKAMGAALESQPDLYDNQEGLAKLDQEMRQTYLGNVRDERILQRANARIDTYLQSGQQAYQVQKAAAQRFELGSRTLQLSVDKLEEQVRLGNATPDQATAEIRNIFGYLRSSPSFQIPQEDAERMVQSLQDGYAQDGSRRALLAKAFSEDTGISAQTRQALRLDYVQGLQQAETERQGQKLELRTRWDALVEKGRFTPEVGEQAVKAGLASAEEVQARLEKQQTLLDNRIRTAERQRWLQTADPRTLHGKDWADWEKYSREHLPKPQYYALMRQAGGVNPVVAAQAQRAMSTLSKPVETEEQIPDAFNTLVEGDANYLYGAGILAQHLPPEDMEDLGTYFYLTQSLGKSKVDAYNLLANSTSSRRLAPGQGQRDALDAQVRDALDMGPEASGELLRSTSNIAQRLKDAGVEPDEAVKTAAAWTRDAYTRTDYGAIPKALYGSYISEDALKSRLDFAARKLAAEHALDASDLQVSLGKDRRFYFIQKGGLTPVGSTSFQMMTENAPALPDGSPTIEGQRQDQTINDTLKPNPFDGYTAARAWRER